MSTGPAFDLEFTPASYGDDDPLNEVFSAIGDEAVHSEAWRLLEEERLEELEKLLAHHGILNADGTFNHDDHYFSFFAERPEEMDEGAETLVAYLDSGMPYVADPQIYVKRVGWHWVFGHSGDMMGMEMDRSTTPLSLGQLIGMLEDTELIEHFRTTGKYDRNFVLAWESTLYPQLRLHYERENEEWQAGRWTGTEIAYAGDDEIVDEVLTWSGCSDLWKKHDLAAEHDLIDDVLEWCSSAEIDAEEWGQGDRGRDGLWYTVATEDPDKLKAEIRARVMKLVEEKSAGT